MSNVLQRLDEFLNGYYTAGLPIIIGYSGGPDSSALLHACWKLKKKYSFDLTVIHIDHGWREESASEAEKLKEYVEDLGFEFILEKIEGSLANSNLEEEARLARLKIFQRHFARINAQAVILAHQAQDQAETVLKRLFEGSHITALGAMKKCSTFENMILWRPFLEIPKEELISYCHVNKVEYLLDRTNEDPRFLRARMRKNLLPLLEEHFGKQIQENLARFSETVHEMVDYFAEKLELEPDDLSKMHPFEAKLALKKIAERNSLKLGKQHIDQLYKLLEQTDGTTRKFIIGGKTFVIRNGVVNLC
jgi:tRNA(Ile)-lysidine synthase